MRGGVAVLVEFLGDAQCVQHVAVDGAIRREGSVDGRLYELIDLCTSVRMTTFSPRFVRRDRSTGPSMPRR